MQDMTDDGFEVVFESDGTRWTATVKTGETLLDAAQKCGAPVHTLCNGIGACVQCRVKVEDNESSLSEPTSLEKDRMGNIFHLTKERMACQAFRTRSDYGHSTQAKTSEEEEKYAECAKKKRQVNISKDDRCIETTM